MQITALVHLCMSFPACCIVDVQYVANLVTLNMVRFMLAQCTKDAVCNKLITLFAILLCKCKCNFMLLFC